MLVGTDNLVTQLLQATGDPFALRRCLDQDPSPWAPSKDLPESNPVRQDPLLDPLATLVEDADLALGLVDVDTDVAHGWLSDGRSVREAWAAEREQLRPLPPDPTPRPHRGVTSRWRVGPLSTV